MSTRSSTRIFLISSRRIRLSSIHPTIVCSVDIRAIETASPLNIAAPPSCSSENACTEPPSRGQPRAPAPGSPPPAVPTRHDAPGAELRRRCHGQGSPDGRVYLRGNVKTVHQAGGRVRRAGRGDRYDRNGQGQRRRSHRLAVTAANCTLQIDVAVNAPEAGTLKELLVSEEDTVTVGQDLARIEPGAAPEGGAEKATPKVEEGESKSEQKPSAPQTESTPKPEKSDSAPKQAEPAPAPTPTPKPGAAKPQPSPPSPPSGAAGSEGLQFSREERRVGHPWNLRSAHV